jgi:hypothetical protein
LTDTLLKQQTAALLQTNALLIVRHIN